MTTTRREAPSPSLSLRRPASATTSWTTLRSKAVIGASLTGSPVRFTSATARSPELGELAATRGAEAGDVQHEAAALAGLPGDREPGELLEGIQDLAVGSDEIIEVTPDDGDHRAIALDVHVDVPVEIGDVQQRLQVVGRDIALALKL